MRETALGHPCRPRIERSGTLSRVPLSRIAWLATVAACLVTALLLLLANYHGYAGLALAVGASAAINLR